MIQLTSTLLLTSYRYLPFWLARIIAIAAVLAMMGAAMAFLYYRPTLRRFQAVFNRIRP